MARILIVEDEERISSFIAKGLKADGFTTTADTPIKANAARYPLAPPCPTGE